MRTTTPPNAFQSACRKEFAFLVEEYGFDEEKSETPEGVTFKKQGWKIAISSTAHGTRASIQILSPDGQCGFFSHLVDVQQPLFDLASQASYLRRFGSAFLNGDWKDFPVLQQRQRDWLDKSGIMSKAEQDRLK